MNGWMVGQCIAKDHCKTLGETLEALHAGRSCNSELREVRDDAGQLAHRVQHVWERGIAGRVERGTKAGVGGGTTWSLSHTATRPYTPATHTHTHAVPLCSPSRPEPAFSCSEPLLCDHLGDGIGALAAQQGD